MAEYIEREAAIEIAMQYCPDDDGTCSKASVDLREMLDEIESIPAADARPVVRGHWISEEEAEEKGDYSLRDACSVCGHCDWDCTESAGFNFFPNCGADMREES